MSIDIEFSRFAQSYQEYDVIQKEVTKKLLSFVKTEPKRILDLGCGSGNVYKMIPWKIEHFIGVDFAPKMLELHPKAEHVECIYGDFENEELYEYLIHYDFDYIISSSALQWAKDLQKVFRFIASFQTNIAVAIFSANTFKTLHKTANIPSLLRSKEEVITLAKRHFDIKVSVENYTLEFENNKELFRYIKKTGVSGKRSVLNYKQTKALMQEYPLSYLEFEVVFLYS